jgi:ribosome maturation factor RimP
MHSPSALMSSIKDIVEKEGCELWSLEIGNDDLLRVFVDKLPAGVMIEDCAIVSRRIRKFLEEDPKNDYRVEVSSPGLERSLKTFEHYERSIGLMVVCQYKADGQTEKREGVLESVHPQGFILRVDEEAFDIPFEQVSKARRVAL